MRIAYICSLLLVDKNVIIWLNNFLDFPLLLYHAIYIWWRVSKKCNFGAFFMHLMSVHITNVTLILLAPGRC